MWNFDSFIFRSIGRLDLFHFLKHICHKIFTRTGFDRSLVIRYSCLHLLKSQKIAKNRAGWPHEAILLLCSREEITLINVWLETSIGTIYFVNFWWNNLSVIKSLNKFTTIFKEKIVPQLNGDQMQLNQKSILKKTKD